MNVIQVGNDQASTWLDTEMIQFIGDIHFRSWMRPEGEYFPVVLKFNVKPIYLGIDQFKVSGDNNCKELRNSLVFAWKNQRPWQLEYDGVAYAPE